MKSERPAARIIFRLHAVLVRFADTDNDVIRREPNGDVVILDDHQFLQLMSNRSKPLSWNSCRRAFNNYEFRVTRDKFTHKYCLSHPLGITPATLAADIEKPHRKIHKVAGEQKYTLDFTETRPAAQAKDVSRALTSLLSKVAAVQVVNP